MNNKLTFSIHMKTFVVFILLCTVSFQSNAQPNNTPDPSKSYKITHITVEGNKRESAMIILRSGLAFGDDIRVPGDEISTAIKKLWDASLFSDVQIFVESIKGNNIGLKI